VNQKGRALHPAWIPAIVRKYARASGITRHTNAHMIRHSTATHMLEHKAPTRFIQELLGHKDISTTQRYTRVAIGSLRDIHRKTHPRELIGG
jgi:site-specific recombinase XerD